MTLDQLIKAAQRAREQFTDAGGFTVSIRLTWAGDADDGLPLSADIQADAAQLKVLPESRQVVLAND